jgi:hypothetical protein
MQPWRRFQHGKVGRWLVSEWLHAVALKWPWPSKRSTASTSGGGLQVLDGSTTLVSCHSVRVSE